MSAENIYETQVRLVEEALAALGERTPHKVSEIRDWLERERPEEFRRLEASWGSYLSRAVGDPTNRIERTPGRYTYSLRPAAGADEPPREAPAEAGPPIGAEPAGSTPGGRQQREMALYPLLADWLRSQEYWARVTAATKRGGIWGNPDVTGIRVVDGFLGQKSLELCSIEAKISSDQWRYWFFEAVAHKRFAHRAYFVFAQGSDEPSLADVVDSAELREYGEKYHVGVLVVFIPVERYRTLVGGATAGLSLALEDVVVEEVWPAIHDQVTPAAQTAFLQETLGLSEDADIYRFDEGAG